MASFINVSLYGRVVLKGDREMLSGLQYSISLHLVLPVFPRDPDDTGCTSGQHGGDDNGAEERRSSFRFPLPGRHDRTA